MGAANRWTSTGGYGWVHHLRMGSRMWPDVARQGLCRSLPHGHRPSVSCVKWPLGESTLGTGIRSGRRNQKVFKKGMGRLWRQKGGCGGWPGCPPWLPCLDLLRLPSLTTLPPSTSPVSLSPFSNNQRKQQSNISPQFDLVDVGVLLTDLIPRPHD